MLKLDENICFQDLAMSLALASQCANDSWLKNVQIKHHKIHIKYMKCWWKKLYILLWRVIYIMRDIQPYSSFQSYKVAEPISAHVGDALFPVNTQSFVKFVCMQFHRPN